jgi:hypothetical protein
MKSGPLPKILLGVLTAWPIVFVIGVLTFDNPASPTSSGTNTAVPDFFFAHFGPFGVVAVGSILLSLGLLLFYLGHVLYSDLVPQRWQRPWLAFLIFGSSVAMLMYWYRYIWNGSPSESSGTHPH